jgi:hypothetical protein
MQFHNYRSFWGSEHVTEYIAKALNSNSLRQQDVPVLNHAIAENAWIYERRPFYRFWPGLFHAFSNVDLSQIRLRNLQFSLPDDLHTIVIEFPKDTPYETYGITSGMVENGEELPGLAVTTLLVYQSTLDSITPGHDQIHNDTGVEVSTCVLCELDTQGVRCHRHGIVFNEEEMEMTLQEYLEYRKSLSQRDTECFRFSARILFLLALLSSDDEKLFQRLILDRDKDKFDLVNAEKFWERAKRNGRYGWDVGKDLPTRDELEEFKASGTLRGKVVPHIRSAHLAKRWTGEGRTILKYVQIDETMVNKHLAKALPEGYYGDANSGVKVIEMPE